MQDAHGTTAETPSKQDVSLSVVQPSRTTVMIKPVGALCNLDCEYCYYLPTKDVWGGRERRMSLQHLESVFASLLPTFDDHVTIVWQGGEPTLAGLDFFRKAIEFQNTYKRPGQTIAHALQTNCTLINDEWCDFILEHKFLVGASIDGPPHLHDHYRVANNGSATSDRVLAGINTLRERGVEFNILCVLNDRNIHAPDAVWNYLLTLGTRWLQFIPAIEWEKDPDRPGRNRLASYSPNPRDYGRFLCRIFDRWFSKHRGTVSVRLFDAVLNKLVLDTMPFCILDGSCHNQLTVEHDGSIFGCDHFIEPRWRLARIGEPEWSNEIDPDGDQNVDLTVHGTGMRKRTDHTGRDIDSHTDFSAKYVESAHPDTIDRDWIGRIDEQRLGNFADRKQRLPDTCTTCKYRQLCHGGCPKHRELGGEIPEPTVLCKAYMQFYKHALPRMNWLAEFLRRDEMPPPPQAMARQ